MSGLADLYTKQGKNEAAQQLLERSLDIVEKAFGRMSHRAALNLNNLNRPLVRIIPTWQQP